MRESREAGSEGICVLGMHRSGTSLTAGVTVMLGAYAGPRERLMPARAEDNPRGFWELEEVMELNDGILAAFGGEWRRPPPLPPGWELDARLDPLRAQAEALLEDTGLVRAERWVLKDPRLCLTHPFWAPLLGRTRFVLTLRDPVAVAASLHRRNGVPAGESHALWARYTAGALQHSAGAAALVLPFDRWFSEPELQLDRLAGFMGATERASDSAVREAVLDFIDAGLRHHEAERSAPFADASVPTEVAALHFALQTGFEQAREADELRRDVRRRAEELSQHRRQLSAVRGALRESEQALGHAVRTLAGIHDTLERVARSRSWRYGHGFFSAMRRLTGRASRGTDAVAQARDDAAAFLAGAPRGRAAPVEPPGPAPEQRPVAPAELDRAALGRLAAEVRRRLGPAQAPRAQPLVSMIVVSRDGRHHLERLVADLVACAYPNFELVVVDNASRDGSADWLDGLEAGFPVRVVRNTHNASFSEANNAGAGVASGELLLFLNNDVRPLEPAWLGELLACRERTGATIVGARLVHVEPAAHQPSGWSLQHRGIRFRLEDGLPRAYNAGDGEDALDGKGFGEDSPCPAVTAACLLVAADDFERLGRFDGRYVYGTEDVDLGLNAMSDRAAVVCCGRALLLHQESSTQSAQGRAFQRANRTQNRRAFLSRWGPALRREIMLERLSGVGFWTEQPAHVAIVRTSEDPAGGYGDWYTAEELATALAECGIGHSFVQRSGRDWTALDPAADAAVVLLDDYPAERLAPETTAVAWVRNWTDRWLAAPALARYDLVLSSSERSAALVSELVSCPVHLFPLATNPARFAPRASDEGRPIDVAFAGNRWGRPRAVEALSPPPGVDLRVHGRGWEESPTWSRWSRGPLAYPELAELYARAKIVLDDAAEHTLPYHSVNSRVFDALAAGAVVLTNGVEGARQLFDADFPTWTTPEELRSLVDGLLADAGRRAQVVERYRSSVLERHTYRHRAERLRELLADRERRLRFCVKIGAPSWAVADAWGDLHFARGLQRELTRRGHACVIQVLEEWEDLAGLTYDVVIHLKGRSTYLPKRGQLNVLWSISHPDELSAEECDAADIVCVASARHAETLARLTSAPVHVLEQATDPAVFFPEESPSHRHDLVLVANTRGVERPIVRDLLPTEHDLAIWGSGWEGLVDPALVAGRHLPNEDVHLAYSSATVVLNDHWPDMAARGYVSNRIYDALACGALVLSDHLPELEERFGGAVVCYRDREELRSLVEHFVRHPEEAAQRGAAGRRLVLEHHTFSHRVERLLELVEQRRTEIGHRDRVTPAPTALVAAA